jgi:hypothetical protein
MAAKKGMTTNLFTLLFCCCFWIWDPRPGMGKTQDPGSVINISRIRNTGSTWRKAWADTMLLMRPHS